MGTFFDLIRAEIDRVREEHELLERRDALLNTRLRLANERIAADETADAAASRTQGEMPRSEITDVRDDASVNDFLRNALAQLGDRHQRGAEVSLADGDPDAFDCSELVEWAANRAGVMVNDGSWLQYRQLHRQGGAVDVDDALRTPGALMFTFSSDPMASRDRPSSAGVAISLGNGQVVVVPPGGEVSVVDADTRAWSHAAVMPGFTDARGLDDAGRADLAALLAEHGLDAPQPDLFDPDGDGVPLTPEEATTRVEALREQAAQLREEAEDTEALHDRHVADLEVARAVLEERQADYQRQTEVLDRASRAEAEARNDLGRFDEDLLEVGDRVRVLEHQLGLSVPNPDLIPPEGLEPPDVAVVTDPDEAARLRVELSEAQSEAARLLEVRQPLQAEVAARVTERQAAEAAKEAAAFGVAEQESDIRRLGEVPPSPDDVLDEARALEAEARQLEDLADEVAERWEEYASAHHDRPVTDLGEIEVRVSGAEAYALGRREHAAALEAEAAKLETQAIRDQRAAADRSELSDLRDERAADLNQRIVEAQVRVDDLQRQADDAKAQADEWSATADRRAADARRLRDAGRPEDAAVMEARAAQANEMALQQQFRSIELSEDRLLFKTQASAWETEATTLEQSADLLDTEAATLLAGASEADASADALLERAARQDRLADEIDEALERGIATELHIVDDVEGTDVTIDIPGRAPVEDDLESLPGFQPSESPELDQPPDITPVEPDDEPFSALPPEPDEIVDELFSSVEAGDDADDFG
ncbi:MAG: hypothetical protein ACRD0G_02790 [Acidimicrobiales bacterium]